MPGPARGGCCRPGVGAHAGDQVAGPGDEGVAEDGWSADAVGAEEPGGVLGGVPGEHIPPRRAHQQAVRFDLPFRAAPLVVTVGEREQAGGREGGLERFDQGRVDASGPRVPGRVADQDPLAQRPQLGGPGTGEGSLDLGERVLGTGSERDGVGGAGNSADTMSATTSLARSCEVIMIEAGFSRTPPPGPENVARSKPASRRAPKSRSTVRRETPSWRARPAAVQSARRRSSRNSRSRRSMVRIDANPTGDE